MAIELTNLKELDFTKQLIFAYLTCERLYPNYVYFSNNFDFGSPAILREAIDFLYLNIFIKNPDKNKINYFSEQVEKNTPGTGDFDTIFVSSALDACTAIYYSLLFLIDKDFLNITYISRAATDSIDMYVQDIESLNFNTDKHFQQKINDHPLMQKEVSVQQGIVTFLTNSRTVDYGDIQTLLRLQENSQKGSLNL